MKDRYRILSHHAFIKGILFLIFGLLLLLWPSLVLNGFVYVLAGGLILLGIPGVLQYFQNGKEEEKLMPLLLGLLLIAAGVVAFFFMKQIIGSLPTFLGMLLIVAVVNDMIQRMRDRTKGHGIKSWQVVVHVLLILVAILIIWNPFGIDLMLRIFGAAVCLLGVVEFIDFRRYRRAYALPEQENTGK